MIYFLSGKEAMFPTYESTTIEEVVKYCQSKSLLAVDTETTGLDFTANKMIMFQIGDEDNQFIIDTRDIDISPLNAILEDRSIVKLFHNSKFDYKFIKQTTGAQIENIYDTMLAEQVLTCGRDGLSNSLAALCGKYLNIEMNKSTRNEFIDMEGEPFTSEQIEYGAKDVEYLINIRGLQFPHVQKYGLEPVLWLENEAALAFADIEFNGLTLDKEKWLEIAKSSEHKAMASSEGLDTFIIDNADTFADYINYNVQGNLFDTTPEQEIRISWDSPKQVLDVFQTYGMDIEDVNAKNLYKHIRNYPIIKDYIKYKETKKLATSYGEGFFKYFKGDGRIHTNFKQILNTGRVASSGPNMQQIPADNKYRNCFIPGEGEVFVSGDYSSQELCVIAYGSQDPVWLEALELGQDLHSVCADLVYGNVWKEAAEDDCAYMERKAKCSCSAHKKLRNGVKTINFG
jgi:DNA polymerase-1